MLPAAIYIYIFISLCVTRVFFQADVLGCGERPGLQRQAVSSHPFPAPLPKSAPFLPPNPQNPGAESLWGFEGYPEQGVGGGCPTPSPILGIPSSPLFSPDSPPLPGRSPLSSLPLSFLPVSCCIPAFFSLSFSPSFPSPLPCHPSRFSPLRPPSPPFSFLLPNHPPRQPYKLRNQNFQGFTSSEPGLLFFFPPSSGRKVGKHSPWAPVTCSEAYRCCVPERMGEERGGMPPSLFPRLSPQGWLSQADAPMPRERGSEAGGEGTWEGGGRAAAPPSQSSPRQGDQRK